MCTPRWTWLLALALAASFACASPSASAGENYAWEAKQFNRLIKRADRERIGLYEGLPREVSKEKPTPTNVTKLGRYYFYTPVKVLKDGDQTALLDILLDPARFSQTGAKFCGGFHPDYSIVIKIDKVVYDYMICFGCHDVMLHNTKTGQTYMAAPTHDTMKILYPMLTAHRQFRPLDNMPPNPDPMAAAEQPAKEAAVEAAKDAPVTKPEHFDPGPVLPGPGKPPVGAP